MTDDEPSMSVFHDGPDAELLAAFLAACESGDLEPDDWRDFADATTWVWVDGEDEG